MKVGEIRVWQSFSCNNSSSYRLVARFTDDAVGKDAGVELTAFLHEHAREFDALTENGDWPNEPTPAMAAIAKKYAFEWEDAILGWGDEMLVGDEPTVVVEGGVLVVYHTYCSGFPKELETFLKARGAAEVEEQTHIAPAFSLLFRIPDEDKRSRDELVPRMTRALSSGDPEDDEVMEEVENFMFPWGERTQYGAASFFCDGKTIGLYAPCEPDEIAPMKSWLAERGVEQPSIRLCAYGDHARFATIAKARCTACQGVLEYLDPRVHGIEAEQLACRACGGMFDLALFLERKQADEKK